MLQKRPVDVPLTCAAPEFIISDTESEDPVNDEYIMVLRGFLCHQGSEPNKGHYISATRCRDSQGGEYQWLLNDDIHTPRVRHVEDIKSLLKEQQPYLLFYQVEPISALGEPPAYSDSVTSESSIVDASAYFREPQRSKSQTENGRLSFDNAIVDDSRGRSSMASSRRTNLEHSSMTVNGKTITGTPKLLSEVSSDSHTAANGSFQDSGATQNSSNHRKTGRSSDKRSSMSLSRMTGRLTKGKSSTSLAGTEQPAEQNIEPTQDTAKVGHRKSRHPKHSQHVENDRGECSVM